MDLFSKQCIFSLFGQVVQSHDISPGVRYGSTCQIATIRLQSVRDIPSSCFPQCRYTMTLAPAVAISSSVAPDGVPPTPIAPMVAPPKLIGAPPPTSVI